MRGSVEEHKSRGSSFQFPIAAQAFWSFKIKWGLPKHSIFWVKSRSFASSDCVLVAVARLRVLEFYYLLTLHIPKLSLFDTLEYIDFLSLFMFASCLTIPTPPPQKLNPLSWILLILTPNISRKAMVWAITKAKTWCPLLCSHPWMQHLSWMLQITIIFPCICLIWVCLVINRVNHMWGV